MKTLAEYQKQANRTISPEGHQHFFKQPEHEDILFNQRIGLLHALTKCSEEIGEMWKPVNRAMWYGAPIGAEEIRNIKEEAGDLLWYLAGPLCRALGCTFEELCQQNISKLEKRYPEKFTEKDALARKDEQEEKPKKLRQLLTFESDEAKKIAEQFRSLGHDVDEQGHYFDPRTKTWLPIMGIWEI